MLTDIAFEQISGNYWYAAYGPFRVVMMKDTGYINATKLCSSGGKDYYNWSRLKSSQELMEAVTRKLNNTKVLENVQPNLPNTLGDTIPQIWGMVCKSITTEKKSDIDKLISGTYCHPLLIPHIGSWISADFAIMVSEVVNAYIEHQYKENIHDMKVQLEICTAAEQHHKMAKIDAIQQREAAQKDKEEAIQQTQELERVVKTKKL